MNPWDGFPRLEDLRNRASTGGQWPADYFHYLETRLGGPGGLEEFRLLEEALETLDDTQWVVLRNKAIRYVTSPDPDRGWYQLISTLNEAKGYQVLQRRGYCAPEFIPEDTTRTPDLKAEDTTTTTILEVKTIQPSDDQIELYKRQRSENRLVAVVVPRTLPQEFESKLSAIISTAAGQLRAYCSSAHVTKIILLVVTFDFDAMVAQMYWPELESMVRHLRPADIIVYLNRREQWSEFA